MKNFSLKEILNEIWKILEKGISNSTSTFHIASLSTINKEGKPSSRSVVIRKVDRIKGTISFNTDIRSNKWKEIKIAPYVSLSFYDFKLKIQIRISGIAKLHNNDFLSEQEWSNLEYMSKVCYATPLIPSSIINLPEETDEFIGNINKNLVNEGINNFGRVNIKIKEIDWLYLIHTGHRRSRYIFNKGNIEMNWIAP